MAESFFKSLHPTRDFVSTRTLLHEALPLTGTIPSGTYNEENIKNYTHGMFQSVYDYPYLSSSSNHIFDITVGISAKSGLYDSVASMKKKKSNIYSQMAQVLVGHDVTGSTLRFDESGDNGNDSGTKMNELIFINFARILHKDEIKKGSFELKLGVSGSYTTPFGMVDVEDKVITITDLSGSDGYMVNSPAGEYGILYATGSALTASCVDENGYTQVGHIYYQAGLACLTCSVFTSDKIDSVNAAAQPAFAGPSDNGESIVATLTGSEISGTADNFRHRLLNCQFNNTVELNSTVYFCRVNHNEFNYSTNPTYVSQSKIQVKETTTDTPVSYITTVGLYNDANELLAVAKLSEPLKKDPSNEFTLRVRLDY